MKLDKTPLVSIIMTVYNVENYINKSIDSILNQSYKNFELLICDDFSSDQSLSIINEYEDDRIKTFRNKENLGYLKAKTEAATGLTVHDYSNAVKERKGFADYQHLNKYGAKLYLEQLKKDGIIN